VINPAGGSFIEDRWLAGNNALNPNFQSVSVAGGIGSANVIVIPGTTFPISTALMRIAVGTQKASLAAGDYVSIQQFIEGPRLRELSNDVHSLQILARSTVANLQFGAALRDPTGSRSLTKLCTLGPASTWSLIPLPNLPIWPSAGTFTTVSGSAGYSVSICVAAGATYMSPSNDTWQNGSFIGAVGQGNLLASVPGSYVDIAFIQHEPGPQCTTPIDCPFTQNYDDCLRYYEKSYPYGVALGSVNAQGMINFWAAAGQNPFIPIRFKKIMAKIPTTIAGYDPVTGAGSGVRDYTAGGTRAISSVNNYGDTGFNGFVITAQNAGIWSAGFHYSADTGW
jgi:hypothetical protein